MTKRRQETVRAVNFATFAQGKTTVELCHTFRVTSGCINRWLRNGRCSGMAESLATVLLERETSPAAAPTDTTPTSPPLPEAKAPPHPQREEVEILSVAVVPEHVGTVIQILSAFPTLRVWRGRETF